MLLKELFYLPKSDRSVLIVVLIAIVGITLLIFGIRGGENDVMAERKDSLDRQGTPFSSRVSYSKTYRYAEENALQTTLFPFDPNTADSTQLLRLGLRPWQVRSIYKYRARGGVYRRPEDFARLYGLTRGQYRALAPYIRIGEAYRPASELFEEKKTARVFERDTIKHPVKLRPTERLSINEADTVQLKKVPGIGSYFARQIVNYRARLGGFHSIRQLTEIEDFPEEALKYFIIPDDQLRKLNLNSMTLNQLKRHPYLNFYQARAIIDYRRLKGRLHSLADLRLSPEFSSADLKRLEPYVEF